MEEELLKNPVIADILNEANKRKKENATITVLLIVTFMVQFITLILLLLK